MKRLSRGLLLNLALFITVAIVFFPVQAFGQVTQGWLDSAANPADGSSTFAQGAMLSASGWAIAPGDNASASKVQILIDGTPLGNATLGGSRPDVATAFGNANYANSGWTFSGSIGSPSAGLHALSVVAFDNAFFSATIANKWITVVSTPPPPAGTNPPFGSLDGFANASDGTLNFVQGATLNATGWAADQHDGAPVSQVQFLMDCPGPSCQVLGTATLGIPRPDVAAAFSKPAFLNSGWTYSGSVGLPIAGPHTVSVVAFNSANLQTTLGSRTINVLIAPPFGWVDQLGNASDGTLTFGQGATLNASGWAADQHYGAPVSLIQIQMDCPGISCQTLGTATLGVPRPDVASAFAKPAYLNSGWIYSGNIGSPTSGTHTISAVAFNGANAQATLGSRTITVVATPPFGWIDQVANQMDGSLNFSQGATLNASGWAADQHYGAPVAQVQILIDGTFIGNATLNGSRPDVAAFYNNQNYTNSGWNYSGIFPTLGSGPHVLSVVAYNQANVQTTLGTRNITVVSAGYSVNGHISSSNCGGGASLPGITVTISTTPTQSTLTDGNGNFSFSNIPNGTYTLTPSVIGPSSLFSPATQTVNVNNSMANTYFNATLGYTVSGTVNYAGASTGQVYLTLSGNNCGATLGTSIKWPASSSFTIQGVSAGNYTLQATMDNLGYGAQNASNPSSSAVEVSISNANATNASVTLTDPATVSLTGSSSAIELVSPIESGAVVMFQPIATNNGNNQVELATGYRLQWSTVSGSACTASSTGKTFPAIGTKGMPVFVTGLSDGPAYFCLQGQTATSTSAWSSVVGPVTIGPIAGANTVSGTITFSGTANGPLYVGCYDQNTQSNIYAASYQNPVSGQAYSISGVPTGADCFMFGIVDQNNDGLIDTSDIQNTNGDNNSGVLVSGNTTANIVLPSGNSKASLATQHFRGVNQGNAYDNYSLNLDVRGLLRLPVSVELVSGPNVLLPMDIGDCGDCGNEFSFSLNVNSRPNTGDSYGLKVTYSDGTSETLNPAVSTVLDAFATNLLPSGSGASTTPTFLWTYPSSPASYSYQFQLMDSTSGNTIWQIPSNKSNSNGFSNSVTQIVWGTDPTGNNNLPTVGNLGDGCPYQWQIATQDSNGNSAQFQASFVTTGTTGICGSSNQPSITTGSTQSETVPARLNGLAGTFSRVNGVTVPYRYVAFSDAEK